MAGMTLTISKAYNIGGKGFQDSRTLTAGAAYTREVSLGPALAGTVATAMTSTTSTTTTLPPGGSVSGTLLLNSVAGLAIGNRLDVYWSGGSLYGATIEDIAGTSIFFTGGTLWSAGTAFPTNGTAITCMVPTALPISFSGSTAQALVMYGDAGGTFIWDTATPTEAYPVVLPTANSTRDWWSGNGLVNPVNGVSITQVFLSHGSSTGSQTMRVGALVNP